MPPPPPDDDRLFSPTDEERLDKTFSAEERAISSQVPAALKSVLKRGETPPPEVNELLERRNLERVLTIAARRLAFQVLFELDSRRAEDATEAAAILSRAHGITPAQVEAAARQAVIVKSGNMSLGVNLLAALVKRAAASLGPEFDIEVLEMHHNRKVDAPSGTALLLGNAAAEGRKIDLDKKSVRSRDGHTGARKEGDIGFATLRGGTVVGVGTTLTDIERVELTTGAGADTISTANLAQDDNIFTGGGDDTVDVGGGKHDVADGGDGFDTLVANMSGATSGVQFVGEGPYSSRFTDAGRDYTLDYRRFEVYKLTGSNFSDKLSGWSNADLLAGGWGADMLTGWQGDDQLFGGPGSDQFRFAQWWTDGRDTINDAAAGDFMRISGITLSGVVTTGTGASLGAGQVQVETNVVGGHSITTVHVGCDGTLGADLHIDLKDVTLAPAAFSLSGSDIKIIAGSTTVPAVGNDLMIGTDGNDNLNGGAGNDDLRGVGGNDVLNGGADADILNGGLGLDNLTGGTGGDTFLYLALSDSPRGAGRDVIIDFSHLEGDKIDVSAIDANPVLAGDQAFALVASFTGAAGQLVFDSGSHVAQFDQNGDGAADLEIVLTGVASVVASDFVL